LQFAHAGWCSGKVVFWYGYKYDDSLPGRRVPPRARHTHLAEFQEFPNQSIRANTRKKVHGSSGTGHTEEQLLRRNVKRFRGGLVFEA